MVNAASGADQLDLKLYLTSPENVGTPNLSLSPCKALVTFNGDSATIAFHSFTFSYTKGTGYKSGNPNSNVYVYAALSLRNQTLSVQLSEIGMPGAYAANLFTLSKEVALI